MKQSIINKLEILLERYMEVERLLSQPDTIDNQNKFKQLSQEYAQLEPVVRTYQNYESIQKALDSTQSMLEEETDIELKALAQEELEEQKKTHQQIEKELQCLLLPNDPNDNNNVFLEIRAGTGGDESALFSGDLYRMYSKFAEKMGWNIEIMSTSEGEHGGYKEVILRISGNAVYAKLKFESGAHRVQRVPVTESQGRIHTSACTVAILPEVDEVESIDINSADLKIDTYRASGAGGQHVNKTDSAIRITHLPTGTVVECQDERSQHKNRARAMSILQSRLLAAEQAKQEQAQAQTRRNLVGSGDRSERIRTYNFPQGRLTDHRINLTLYKLEAIMEGDLEQVISPLYQEYQADLLSELGQDAE